MDNVNIEGVLLTPLRRIHHPLGDVFHGIKKSDDGFSGFGEAYFTTINANQIKGWNKHKKMTLNLVVPGGKVIFVLYDGREGSRTKDNIFKIELSADNYQRLTVPPGVWMAFKGKNHETNLILNIADIEHDPDEIERLDLNKINYNWNAE